MGVLIHPTWPCRISRRDPEWFWPTILPNSCARFEAGPRVVRYLCSEALMSMSAFADVGCQSTADCKNHFKAQLTFIDLTKYDCSSAGKDSAEKQE